MKRLVMVLFCLFMISCTATPPTSQPTAAPAKQGKLRINLSTDRVISNIPTRMALDALKAQGYEIEAVPFAQFNLVPAALSNGELDLSTGSYQTIWAAIGKGGKLRSIVGWTNNPYYIAANVNVKTCADLQGKRVGMTSSRGLVEVMLDDYLKKNCNSAQPEYLTLANGEARVAGLLKGEIDAARLELDNVLDLDKQAAGKFTRLIEFGKAYPNIQVAGIHVSSDFASKNPQLVQDFVLELLLAQRSVQDPSVLQAQIVKYYQLDPADAKRFADAYSASHVWDVNGGLDAQKIQTTMDFIVQAKGLEQPLTVEQVSDLSFLNAALNEIGRK
jgi:ABC-type nitrate/sulfonate/bicarbonate transport system substrate-binding protein